MGVFDKFQEKIKSCHQILAKNCQFLQNIYTWTANFGALTFWLIFFKGRRPRIKWFCPPMHKWSQLKLNNQPLAGWWDQFWDWPSWTWLSLPVQSDDSLLDWVLGPRHLPTHRNPHPQTADDLHLLLPWLGVGLYTGRWQPRWSWRQEICCRIHEIWCNSVDIWPIYLLWQSKYF